MSKTKDLTQGSIGRVLAALAAPLIGSSFVGMTYTMVDLFWLARLGSGPVAGVGAAFFIIWLNTSLSMTTKIGSEISVSQSFGAGMRAETRHFAQNAFGLSVILGILMSVLVIILAPVIMKVFLLPAEIAVYGTEYLRWVALSLLLSFLINTMATFFYGTGNSHTPFKIISSGLILNILLDPLFIIGIGGFEGLGVRGAAVATVISELVVVVWFSVIIFTERSPVGKLSLNLELKKNYALKVVRLGLPASIQGCIFSCIGMSLASLAGRFGHIGVAAQSIGSQIEAISWNTASGFSTALSAFVGQNYGAGLYQRIKKGYIVALSMAGMIGFAAGLAFIFFPRQIFSVFISEPDALAAGADYMRIMGFSQLLMVVELVTTGAFNGVGKTKIPAAVSIVFNSMRIPLAICLSATMLGLSGIWWSITISSCLKGAVLGLWFCFGVLYTLTKKGALGKK